MIRVKLNTIDLILKPKKMGRRGMIYDVIYQGEVLVTSHDPGGNACRALQELGVKGVVRFWREGKDFWDYKYSSVEKGARVRVQENNRYGPRVLRWQPFEMNSN